MVGGLPGQRSWVNNEAGLLFSLSWLTKRLTGGLQSKRLTQRCL